MTSGGTYVPLLVGALALTAGVGLAEAQTPLNMGGSSAARNFMTDIPLNLCDAAPLPSRFASADGNKITWICNRGGSPVIMRYSATASSDGVNKLLQPAGNPLSNMLYLDHTLTTGCTGPVLTTRPSDGKQYHGTTGCANTNTIGLPMHMGAADAEGAAFHQTGPIGNTITPLNDSSLATVQTAIVPYTIFLGKGVVKVNTAGNPAGAIDGLSRVKIEAIFSRSITDWRQLGYGTVTDAAPGTLEATSPITLCLRAAGSGSYAVFDETLMINATATPLPGPQVIFSSSTSGVLACLANNRRSIGYADSDALVNFEPGGSSPGLAYRIKIDGGQAPDPKHDLRCGCYAFWSYLRLHRRPAGEGAAIDSLALAFIANAGANINMLPTARFWASEDEMAVSKNRTRGPIIWKPGPHPECWGG